MNMTIDNRNSLAPRRIDLFSELTKEFNRVSNEVFGAPFFKGISKHKGYPLVDAIRGDNSLWLQYTVPGVKKEDLNVEIVDDELGQLLVVSGKLSANYIVEDSYYQIRELSSQEFRRIVRLPDDLDFDKDPLSNLENGILTITFRLKKTLNENKSKTKKLTIK